VLYRLTQHDLSSILFPLGDLTKDQVREAASKADIPVAGKSESQEICFLEGTDYREFLCSLPGFTIEPGPILDSDGGSSANTGDCLFIQLAKEKALGFRGARDYM